MFKRVMNIVLSLSLFALDPSWDLIGSGNSFLLFGEPQYPTEL